MSKTIFMEIFSRIEDSLYKIDLVGDVIPPLKRFAICMARLVRGDYYRTISELYGVGKVTFVTYI